MREWREKGGPLWFDVNAKTGLVRGTSESALPRKGTSIVGGQSEGGLEDLPKPAFTWRIQVILLFQNNAVPI